MLKLVPLGGLGEIGLNSLVVEAAGERLLVDAGLMFPPPSAPGVDAIYPDFGYLLDEPNRLSGILLTHGHEDHLGALPALLRKLQAPVYGAPYTLGVARRKLEEAGINADLREIAPRERRRLGETFNVEALHVCHSTPDALGFSIDTPEGRVVHTGDFKLDDTPGEGRNTDLERLGELGEEGVLCLLSDSTNAEVEGHTPSERLVEETFARLLPGQPGRVVIALFASNIPRIRHLLALAERLGRRVALVGRSMVRAVELATSLSLLNVPPGLLVSTEDAARLPRERLLILTTGAQAEPRAGLRQLAAGELGDLALLPGDHVYLSARAIPGNERAVSDLLNRLCTQGAQVTHAAVEPGIHVSGHAAREQQRRMLQTVRPRHFVPIHGEARHLRRHLDLARETGVAPEGLLLAGDGDVLQFEQGRGALVGTTATARRFVGRGGATELLEHALRERRTVAEAGLVVATVVVDRETGALLTGPRLSGRGLSKEEDALLAHAEQPVREQFLALPLFDRTDQPLAEETLARAVRRVFRERLGRRPSILAQLVKL